MERETQPPAAPPPPPAKMVGETQAPPAEVDTESPPQPAEMEGERQPLPASVIKVLDDDNLVAEIIVRVGFPTSLVRAAAVCRPWLRLASDRAFLRRFRKLHQPRLLGFYTAEKDDAPFFPRPQPPPSELAAVIRRASFKLGTYKDTPTVVLGCWNGRVVTMQSYRTYEVCDDINIEAQEITFQVHNPLCPERGMTITPTLRHVYQEDNSFSYGQLFCKGEGSAVCYFYVMVESSDSEDKSMVQVYMLRNGDDGWSTHFSLTVDCLMDALSEQNSVLVDNKIYMASTRNEVVVLDLTASSLSTIQLPQGVDFRTRDTTMLSRGDDASSLYLIHAKELELHIWLHKEGNWSLVDNICLHEMCARFLEDEPTALLQISHVGDYTGEFLFLQLGRCTHYLDVKCRTLRKVYEMTEEDLDLCSIYPFMMIWPPIFPALKDGPASNAT